MAPLARRFLLVLAAAGLVAVGASANAGAPAAPEMSMGAAWAKVTVIEYASTTCPHCARWNAEVFPEFKRKYVDTGLVRYVFREFPTSPVAVASAGFLIARCAPAEKYFDVIDSLFRGQAEMFEAGDAGPTLLKAGRAGGLSDEKSMACAQDRTQLEALNERVAHAYAVEKIEATPTFVIGSRKVSGEQPLAALDAIIQPLLAAK